ncbi:MAG: ROK family protein [Bacilli bacterium]|nr:ROK family protein [Bacilli bacterium]
MRKIISLDIGGTNTRVSLINEKYEVEKTLISDTVVGNTDKFLANVVKTVREAISEDDMKDVIAISAGVPGRVRENGFIDILPNIHISNIPFSEYMSKAFGLPAYALNDAQAAALAEANVGPWAKNRSVYFVTISTGVGGALCVDGILKNSSNEAGHTMVPYKGEVHEFEHMCSGTGLIRLCDMNDLYVANAKEFFEMVQNENYQAVAVYKDWIKMLSRWFSMMQELYQPDVFAVTGGVMKSAHLFFDELKATTPACKIEAAGCGQMAGLLGAAVYGFYRVKNQ